MGSRSAIICAVVGIISVTTGGTVSKAVAFDIIDDWANVRTPTAPEIKAVTVDPKSTALIMGDLVNQLCANRPRCVAALPAMKKLVGEARAAKVAVTGLVTYTGGAAALRGLNVVIPADGMASVEAFAEQYVAWHMTHAPIISSKVTLTRTGMIKF
jgi:hypothetical protein